MQSQHWLHLFHFSPLMIMFIVMTKKFQKILGWKYKTNTVPKNTGILQKYRTIPEWNSPYRWGLVPIHVFTPSWITQWLEFSPKSGWVPLVPCPLLKFWDPFRDAFAHIFYQELSNKLPTEKCFDKLADFNSPLHKVKCSATAAIRWWGETKFLPDLKNVSAGNLWPVTGRQCPEPFIAL